MQFALGVTVTLLVGGNGRPVQRPECRSDVVPHFAADGYQFVHVRWPGRFQFFEDDMQLTRLSLEYSDADSDGCHRLAP